MLMKFFVGWKVSPVTTHSILVPIQIKILMDFLNRTYPQCDMHNCKIFA